jgi:hypothetical protein
LTKRRGLYLTYEELKTALGWAKAVYAEYNSINDNVGLENKLRTHLNDNKL